VPSEDLHGSWERTRAHLERARTSLTDPHDEALAEYRYNVEANELGLGFDALTDVAESQRAPSEVWRALAAAGAEMRIKPDDAIHGATIRKIRDHLAAAHEWFELRDLVNRWDPIGIYDPETNFPPDEYDCLDAPLMTRLRAGESSEQIGDFLHHELHGHFGLDPDASRPYEFAQLLTRWFAEGATNRPTPPAPSRDDVTRAFRGVLEGREPREQASRWAMQWLAADDQDVEDEAVWSALNHLGGIDLRHGEHQPYLYDNEQIEGWLTEFLEQTDDT
jgi:hypothetical protein